MTEVWIHLKTGHFVLRIFEKGGDVLNRYVHGDDFDFNKHWNRRDIGMWKYLGKL